MARGSNRGLGIDWNFPSHEGLINNRGETVIHEVGMRCTCNMEDMFAGQVIHGAHVERKRRQLGCAICGGEGYIYRRPSKIVALISGIKQSKTQMEAGFLYPGDAMMSTKLGYQVSAGDLVTFTWPQPVPDGQVILRGAASLDENQERKTGLDDNEDRLWYNADNSIHCEDEDGNVYNSNGDFILDSSKIIRWVGSNPPKGKAYVLKYNAYLEWVAFSPPDVRRDRDRDFGGRTYLRKRHIALANDPNVSIKSTDRLPFCERIRGCS